MAQFVCGPSLERDGYELMSTGEISPWIGTSKRFRSKRQVKLAAKLRVQVARVSYPQLAINYIVSMELLPVAEGRRPDLSSII